MFLRSFADEISKVAGKGFGEAMHAGAAKSNYFRTAEKYPRAAAQVKARSAMRRGFSPVVPGVGSGTGRDPSPTSPKELPLNRKSTGSRMADR